MFGTTFPLRRERQVGRRYEHRSDDAVQKWGNRFAAAAVLAMLGSVAALLGIPVLALLSALTGH